MLRFRPPWFRDARTVKASTFWSQPPPPTDVEAASILRAEMLRRSEPVRQEPLLPEWPHPGGIHEFGAWWGLSLISGHLWGDAKDVKYMPIDVRYSYLLSEHERWALRYAPELTALAMLDEPVPNQRYPELQRKRTYGSGLSPFGFQTVLFPDRRDTAISQQQCGIDTFHGSRTLAARFAMDICRRLRMRHTDIPQTAPVRVDRISLSASGEHD